MERTPISAKIFGILNIAFALFDIVVAVFMTALLPSLAKSPNPMLQKLAAEIPAATLGTMFFRLSTDGLLVIAGTGLLLFRNWGRVLSLITGVVMIVLCFYPWNGIGQIFVGILYPLILLIFMVRLAPAFKRTPIAQ